MKYIKYTKELLEEVIVKNTTWSGVCRALGRQPDTGSQTHIAKRAKAFGLTWSHFPGQAHLKGKIALNKKKIEEFLKKDFFVRSHYLKLRLFAEGLKKQQCEKCESTMWMGEKIVLELDHIDNDHLNNELENLMILCPNCHALKTRKAYVKRKKIKIKKEIDRKKIYKERHYLRKVVRPNKDILLNEIIELGYCATGRKYGVSDNAIRKWKKDYERSPLGEIGSTQQI